MRRVTFWLSAITLTFIFGVAAVLIYLKFFDAPPTPAAVPETVVGNPESVVGNNKTAAADSAEPAFCELVRNPEKYHGKIVRLHARLLNGIEGSWFSDPLCGSDNAAVVLSSNEEVWKIIMAARDKKYKALPKHERSLSNDLDLTVTGKFINIVFNEGGLIAPFRFEILAVEKVWED